jgi:uncharacterized protein
MEQTKFCIDTNVLFSFQKGILLGDNPSEVAHILQNAVEKKKITIYMPPRIVEELEFMTTPETKDDIHTLLTHVVVQSPNPHTQTIGAQALYDFVGENRVRTLQGLHTSEDVLVQAAQQYSQAPVLGRVDLQKSLQPLKENLRNRFRNATRTGFIDSLADLDLIFLARETDSFLVTADEGVLVWGRKLGAKEMSLPVFGTTIKQSLE